jgi:hypothetical protein
VYLRHISWEDIRVCYSPLPAAMPALASTTSRARAAAVITRSISELVLVDAAYPAADRALQELCYRDARRKQKYLKHAVGWRD